jgi:hypothetical protein
MSVLENKCAFKKPNICHVTLTKETLFHNYCNFGVLFQIIYIPLSSVMDTIDSSTSALFLKIACAYKFVRICRATKSKKANLNEMIPCFFLVKINPKITSFMLPESLPLTLWPVDLDDCARLRKRLRKAEKKVYYFIKLI